MTAASDTTPPEHVTSVDGQGDTEEDASPENDGFRASGAAALAGFPDPKPTSVRVSNETRARIIVRANDSALNLAPLERRDLREEDCEKFELNPLELLGYVKVDHESTKDHRLERGWLFVGAFYGGLAFLLWGWFFGTSLLYWTILGLCVTAAVGFRLRREELGVRVVQAIYLAIVLVVGVGMPVVAIWAGGNVDNVWDTALNGAGDAQEQATLVLLGRAIQTVFVVVVTLLPGLLFFLFDRYRLSTLGEEFTRQVFRLDPSLKTRADIHAKYGHLMDEAFGRHLRRKGRLQPGTRLPIIVATVIFALGWIVVLLNAEVDVDVLQTGVRSLIAPWPSAVAFAFLGAYVFILQAALRAYLRGDLRPKFYSYAALRVVVAVVFAWVLEMMFPTEGDAPLLLITAFAVGLVPDTFILRLREFLRDTGGLKDLTEKHPLTKLEGLDIYDRTRLEQEGVTNIEALAHSNLIELILQTRIPPGRLVDWTDQAQLYLHLVKSSDDGSDKPQVDERDAFRALGIRTASDLLVTVKKREGPEAELLLQTLGGPGGSLRIRTIIDSISDDEWMCQILSWHDPRNREERTLRFPQDFIHEVSPLHSDGTKDVLKAEVIVKKMTTP